MKDVGSYLVDYIRHKNPDSLFGAIEELQKQNQEIAKRFEDLEKKLDRIS